MRPVPVCLLVWVVCATSVFAQETPVTPITIRDVAVSGSLRTRTYSWTWFGDSANGDYLYPGSLARIGLSQSRTPYDWQLEFALPFVLSLPSNAIGPGVSGQLGLGAAYFAANNSKTNTAALFIKQAAIRLTRLGGIEGQSLKVGRMEFNDGTEVSPKNPVLATLKRDRISQRLLGNFGFSDVGRSIDGAQYVLNRPSLNVTVLGGRPTQGVFQVDGWPELNVNLLYGALSVQVEGGANSGEWRLFGLAYRDYRDGVLKTDNRPLGIRRADTESINIATFGGHYLGLVQTPSGALDVLAWVAWQEGSWGVLRHRAAAFAAEAGWQPKVFSRLKPWVRGGFDYGSGDGNPTDQTHGTFFQVLPTPRIYARLPFYNLMNSADPFGELIVRPAKRMTLRSDVHALRLADAHDLWYSGGGAFQTGTFGYTGRPSNGESRLATLYDVSADYGLSAHVALGLYYGYAAGGPVTRAIYATGNLHFGYIELLLHF